MTTLPPLSGFLGTVPDKATQTKEEFAINVHAYLNYFNTTFTPEQIAHSTSLNTLSGEIETLAAQVSTSETTSANSATLAQKYANEVEGIEIIAGEFSSKHFSIKSSNFASNSAISAAASEVSRLAAETIFDTFDDKWLGSKSVEPTLDNDGDPLQDGAIYVKQIADAPNEMYVYDLGSTVWVNMNFVPTAHSSLTGNSNPDIHPISSITGLITALLEKANQATTYTKTEVDSALANVSSSPTQAQIMAYIN